jgi:hypothetical protein
MSRIFSFLFKRLKTSEVRSDRCYKFWCFRHLRIRDDERPQSNRDSGFAGAGSPTITATHQMEMLTRRMGLLASVHGVRWERLASTL